MAIYHLSIKITGRGKGKSAVAAAAYRAGEIIKNDYDGKIHDYSRKRGIVHTEIMLPDHAPREYYNRSVLWNSVETIEKSKNSQLAREFEIALPIELTKEQNLALVREYVKHNFVDKGMCADICIHDTGDGNPHAHILTTMRPINSDGTWGSKHKKDYILDENGSKIYDKRKKAYKCKRVSTTDWDEQTKAEEWRKAWAESLNLFLKRYEKEEQVDHRSYLRQGKMQIPTIHLGSEAFQMEKRGIRTVRGDRNREVDSINQEIRRLSARIRRSKDELFALPLAEAPSMVDVAVNAYNWRTAKTRWQQIDDLKRMVNIHNFFIETGIRDMGQLADKAVSMYDESRDIYNEVKKVDRRLDTLNLHLHHYDIWEKHRKLNRKYNELAPKKRDEFYAMHKKELDTFKESHEYIVKVLNGNTTIPAKKWKIEQEELLAKRYSHYERYYDLRNEIKVVEQLRRSADELMKDLEIERLPQKKREFER